MVLTKLTGREVVGRKTRTSKNKELGGLGTGLSKNIGGRRVLHRPGSARNVKKVAQKAWKKKSRAKVFLRDRTHFKRKGPSKKKTDRSAHCKRKGFSKRY